MVVTTGWRGSSGSIPSGPHGSGGQFGTNLSTSGLGGTDPTTNQQVVSNTAGLPIRAYPIEAGFTQRPGHVPGNRFGVPGNVYADASGNPGVATQDARARTSGAPPWGSGEAGAGPPGGRQDGYQAKPDVLGVGQETAWRGGWNSGVNDKLWATDRHGVLNTGTERGGGRDSGQTDPPMDGPPRPSLRLIQRTINWQQGNPLAFQDHLPGENRGYSQAPVGRVGYINPVQKRVMEPGPQYLGEQGTGWSPVYGGVPGLYQPYGSYAGYTADPIKGIQSPAAEGAPGDGPQKVWSGPPHGLHSATYPDYSSTLGRYMAIPQMTLPRIDRPANSTSEGQSFSQTIAPQGETGTAAVQSGSGGQGSPGTAWRGVTPGGGNTG